MNIALEQTEEYVNGQVINSFHAKLFWLLLRYKHQRMSIKTCIDLCMEKKSLGNL